MSEVKQISTESLILYERNPRKNDHVVDRLAGAIREFGFQIPILIKKDLTVIDGHLRLKAAKKLGLKKVPSIMVEGLTETQIKALRLSINKMGELADWDSELLSLELEDLRNEDFDLDLVGFDEKELKLFDELANSEFNGDENPGKTQELDPEDFEFDHKCPKCGFEFND